MDEADTRRRGPRRAVRGASPVLRARLVVVALLLCVLADAGPLAPTLVAASSRATLDDAGARRAVGDRSMTLGLAGRGQGDRAPRPPAALLSAHETTFLAPDGARDDNFGFSVAISADGSRALLGANRDSVGALVRCGSAHVFVRSGTAWVHEAMLVAADAADSDAFGFSVALSADASVALIGARTDDTPTGGENAGSARVFVRTGTVWRETATLTAAGGRAHDQFGQSVALSADGTRALVGSPLDDAAGLNAGTARVFVGAGASWSEEAALVAADASASDWLGYAVALSGDASRALVTARVDDTPRGVDAGSARVFVRIGTTWTEEAALFASDGSAYDELGWSAALSADGTRAILGAPRDGTAGGIEAGSARVFARGASWTEEATLTAADGATYDNLGHSVSISADGTRALVGAPADGIPGVALEAGTVRLFERAGSAWLAQGTLRAPDAARTENFGWSCAISADGSRALVGRYRHDSAGGLDAGSAAVFSIRRDDGTGAPCTDPSTCPSGFCVDGVCCESGCGAGATDCQACTGTLTGASDGTCAPLTAAAASSVTCRGASDACDAPEVCVATSTSCPADTLHGAATICRASTGACDPAETCSGASSACPADVHAGASTVCRASAGPCDVEERCDGSLADCPTDTVASAGATCGTPSDAPCDAPDTCDGVSVECPDAFLVDLECRASLGPCDPAEQCTGSSATCPVDLRATAGTQCRESSDLSCDPPESCDGTAQECPADVTSCGAIDAGPIDAGSPDGASPDAGSPDAAPDAASPDVSADAARPDASAGVDAASPGPPAAGCGCSVRPSGGAAGTMATLLVLLGLRRRARKRSERPGHQA